MKILVAEDDLISSQILAELLTDWGYHVLCADNGETALAILNQPDAPRMVLLDWEMPIIDGLSLCRQLRGQNRQHYVYVLLLTGRTHQQDIVQGLEAGADDYVTKPFDPHELKVRLNAGRRILDQEAQMLSLMEQLKEETQMRRRFVSSLTHDLRTPLVAENRALELLGRQSAHLPKGLLTLVESLQQNNQDLLNMVNQLLSAFQIEAGKAEIHTASISLHELVASCLISVYPLAAKNGILCRNHIDQDFPSIQVDRDHLRRILGNLIGNALEHLSPGCHITLSATALDNGYVEIVVSDDGPGIPPQFLPHLFERYYTSAGLGGKTGNGLGLSICKTLVELHQGTIAVKSVLNQGTQFFIRLPNI